MTPLECGIIFDGIPEGAISRKVGLIWGIPVDMMPTRETAAAVEVELKKLVDSNPGQIRRMILKFRDFVRELDLETP